ncbi:GTP cyclohydrolase I [Dictyobacter aurantiacus]|uniref:GTP cyclohydrolase 1 n=1 Tax=Dictyobacter aurantiacus TaxID=1936993 RepID=A0A401ZQB4_9CHLR|nr:GTP cyclohydrolase I [Dictyobacter aurantiacus]GCE09073.1 GTP cyclohydrolase 1 [Dictyobacter aurantiacus]
MVLHLDRDHSMNNGHAQHNGHKEDTHMLNREQEQVIVAGEQRPAAAQVDYPRLLELGRELLVALGENPDREGLAGTPRRWADWWREFIEYDPGTTETTFSSVSTDQIVCVSGMRVFSLCEHHLLPMWCDVAIGYIPGDKVLGLSKFARIAHQFAHQLQIQERLGQQIADEVSRITGTNHVAVIVKGEHLCMSARGIRTPGVMTSSVMRGSFRTDRDLRAEFMQMIQP